MTEWTTMTVPTVDDSKQECDHDPITYTKHPSGDIATKCRKCFEPMDSVEDRQ